MGTLKCPHCGGEHSDEDLVCPATGEDISPALAQVGKIIGGKYELLSLMGEGGMGAVYEARHVEIRQKVAVKLLHFQLARDHEIRQRFFREAMAAGEIGHENIIQMHDIGRDVTGSVYLVMEMLKGESLAERVTRSGAMDTDLAVDIMLQVLDALASSHQKGIVHRDMKPENIFLCRLGGRDDFVKILDFGIAKVKDPADGESLTRTGTMMGTSHYMAPEQIAGDREADHRIDIYACGVILYQMLVGRVPFDATSVHGVIYKIMNEEPPPLSSTREGLPAGLEDIIRRAMKRERSERFQSASDFAFALQPFGSGRVVFGRGSQVPAAPPESIPANAAGTSSPATAAPSGVQAAETPVPAPSAKAQPPVSGPKTKPRDGGSPIASVLLVVLPLLLIGGIGLVVVVALGGLAVLVPSSRKPEPQPRVEQTTPASTEQSFKKAGENPDPPATVEPEDPGPEAQEPEDPEDTGEVVAETEPVMPTPLGDKEAAAVQKRVKKKYQKDWNKLAKKHDLVGQEVTLQLTISDEGKVEQVSASDPDLAPEVLEAISEAAASWEFPGLESSGTCSVQVQAVKKKKGKACPCPPNDKRCQMLKCT